MIGCKIFNNWLYECYKLIQMKMHDDKLKFIGPKVWDPYITQIMACKKSYEWFLLVCMSQFVIFHVQSCYYILIDLYEEKRLKSDELHCSSSSRRKKALSVSSSDSLTVAPRAGWALWRLFWLVTQRISWATQPLTASSVDSVLQCIVFDSLFSLLTSLHSSWRASPVCFLSSFFPSTAGLVSFL